MTFSEKKKTDRDYDDAEELRSGSSKVLKIGESKRMRRLSPLGMRVVVQIRKDTNVTDGGLYLPEGAKQSLAESLLAQVVEVASAIDHRTDEESNISGVPFGALVLIPKHSGVKIPWDEDLRIVETKEVLAVVSEVEIV